MWWRGALRKSAPRTASASAASSAPARIRSRSGARSWPPRQAWKPPSAATRARLQSSQKFSVMAPISPISPSRPSRSRARRWRAGPQPRQASGVSSKPSSSSRRRTSASGTTSPPAKGICSMKRGSAPRSQAKRTSAPSSSSLTPRITTALSLSERKRPAAASMPARTRSSRAARPEIPGSRSGASVSSETLSAPSPASASGPTSSASRWPLVVSATSSMPGVAAAAATISSEVAPQRRLAAGEPDAPHAQRREEAEEPAQLRAA